MNSETNESRTETAPRGVFDYLPLDSLHFDPENPRFPPANQGKGDPEALSYLLLQANLIDLMSSIATQGFFPGEPVLVVERSEGEYTVVEGNRRFAACLLLSYPERAPARQRSIANVLSQGSHRPTDIPALIFSERQDILRYLGYRHISGIQEWSPLAKARYLHQLWTSPRGPEQRDDRLRWTARTIGSRSDYVARLLAALRLYDFASAADFFDLTNVTEETVAFSLLTLAISRPPIATFVGLSDTRDFEGQGIDSAALRDLLQWLYEEDEEGTTVLVESRNMKKLASVVEQEEPLAALRAGASLEHAYMLALYEDDVVGRSLVSALEFLEDAASLLNEGHRARPGDLDVAVKVATAASSIQPKLSASLEPRDG